MAVFIWAPNWAQEFTNIASPHAVIAVLTEGGQPDVPEKYTFCGDGPVLLDTTTEKNITTTNYYYCYYYYYYSHVSPIF